MARNDKSTPSYQEIANALGVDRSYVSRVMTGVRPMPVKFAIRVHKHFGLAVGPLAGKTIEEIEAIAQAVEALAAVEAGAAA